MEKTILQIILLLAIAGCSQTNKHNPSNKIGSVQTGRVIKLTEPEDLEQEALRKWNELEEQFSKAPMQRKDSLLMELFYLKLQWNYSCYLEDKFDSLVWAFLKDKRTFYHPFQSHSPKWFVSTSNDKRVRMYSYLQSGGTAADGRTIFQYLDRHGHVRIKELPREEPEHGGYIAPIYKTIKKKRNGYMLYGGTQVSSQEYYETEELLPNSFFTEDI